MEHLMRHIGSPPKGGATARSSFAPAGDSEAGDHLFRRPRRARQNGVNGGAPVAFGQYATSRAVLIGGCPAVGEVSVAMARRRRSRSS